MANSMKLMKGDECVVIYDNITYHQSYGKKVIKYVKLPSALMSVLIEEIPGKVKIMEVYAGLPDIWAVRSLDGWEEFALRLVFERGWEEVEFQPGDGGMTVTRLAKQLGKSLDLEKNQEKLSSGSLYDVVSSESKLSYKPSYHSSKHNHVHFAMEKKLKTSLNKEVQGQHAKETEYVDQNGHMWHHHGYGLKNIIPPEIGNMKMKEFSDWLKSESYDDEPY